MLDLKGPTSVERKGRKDGREGQERRKTVGLPTSKAKEEGRGGENRRREGGEGGILCSCNFSLGKTLTVGRLSVGLSFPLSETAAAVLLLSAPPRSQDISIDRGGRRRPAATAPQHGAQQQMQILSC